MQIKGKGGLKNQATQQNSKELEWSKKRGITDLPLFCYKKWRNLPLFCDKVSNIYPYSVTRYSIIYHFLSGKDYQTWPTFWTPISENT